MNADQVTTGSTINPRRSIAAVIAAALAWLIAPTPVLALNAYITNNLSNTVSVIDTATNTVIATVSVGGGPFGVAVTPDGSKVYVTNGDNTVSVIATATNTVIGSPIPVGREPFGVAVTPDGSKVYVTISIDNTVSVIDTATDTVIGSPIPVGRQPFGVAVTPDGSKVYVTNGDNTVSVIATSATHMATPCR
jgi:YVTN family beta-propeller protein